MDRGHHVLHAAAVVFLLQGEGVGFDARALLLVERRFDIDVNEAADDHRRNAEDQREQRGEPETCGVKQSWQAHEDNTLSRGLYGSVRDRCRD